LDGEVVVLDEAGRSQFQLLQNYRKTGAGRLMYCVFDLLFQDGRDLRDEPLRVRKQLLTSILKGIPNVTVNEFVEDREVDFLGAAVQHGLEGMITKDGESPYREGRRGPDWLKIKTHNRQEAVNARVESQDRPDYLVIDLDPVDVPFTQVIEAAVVVRKALEQAEITGLCKTSGKRGLHVFVPVAARYTHDEARQFAELVAQLVHRELPDITSLVRDPRQRRGRVYLDYLQNRRGQTLAAPYSVRPHPGATVSTPLEWREVRKGLDPGAFTMRNLARRLDRLGDLWEAVLGPGIDLAKSLDRLARKVQCHNEGRIARAM
jgi:hypothetical protein